MTALGRLVELAVSVQNYGETAGWGQRLLSKTVTLAVAELAVAPSERPSRSKSATATDVGTDPGAMEKGEPGAGANAPRPFPSSAFASSVNKFADTRSVRRSRLKSATASEMGTLCVATGDPVVGGAKPPRPSPSSTLMCPLRG